MSDLLLDLVAYFIAQNVVTAEVVPGVITNINGVDVVGPDVPTGEGVNVFRDTAPDSPDAIVVVYEYASGPSTPQIASVHRSVQVVVRDSSATNAKNKARSLYGTLITDDGIINLTATRWGAISLRQVPFKIKVDIHDRVYYGFNFGITTYND